MHTCSLEGIRTRSRNRDIGSHTYLHAFSLSPCLHGALLTYMLPWCLWAIKMTSLKNLWASVIIWHMHFSKVDNPLSFQSEPWAQDVLDNERKTWTWARKVVLSPMAFKQETGMVEWTCNAERWVRGLCFGLVCFF